MNAVNVRAQPCAEVASAAMTVGRGMFLFDRYQPATNGEIVSAAEAILDKWL